MKFLLQKVRNEFVQGIRTADSRKRGRIRTNDPAVISMSIKIKVQRGRPGFNEIRRCPSRFGKSEERIILVRPVDKSSL